MKHPFQIPTSEKIENLIGEDLYYVWTSLCQLIEQKYEMERLWNNGGKRMNTNIVEEAKPFVPYMLRNILSAL